MRRITQKSLALVTGTAVVIAGAGVAYAFWTAGGSGTGAAEAGTSVALTAVQTSTVDDLAPGVAAQNLSGNFSNTNDGSVYVATVTASISSVAKAAGAPAGTCDASDYTLSNAVMDVGAQVPAGTGVGNWGVPADVATIAFNNKAGANQDACKLATVNLAYAIT